MDTLISLAPFALVGAVFAFLLIRRRNKASNCPSSNRRATKDWRNDNVGGASDGGMDGGSD